MRGCGGASGWDLQSSIPADSHLQPQSRKQPQHRPALHWGQRVCSLWLCRAHVHHMMAQRLRRSAPWKRRAACTCLQRAQPTLLSSSLKSSRMCQLYLAEHST